MAATSEPVLTPLDAARAPASLEDVLQEIARPRLRGSAEVARCTRLLGADARAPHLLTRGGTHVRDAVAGAAELIASGAIVAVRGLRRYQLACRADELAPVRVLRTRTRREHRPLALMVDGEEASMPPPALPDLRKLGVTLPRTPLHELLLRDALRNGVRALVITSDGSWVEPAASDEDAALARVRPIADAFLVPA